MRVFTVKASRKSLFVLAIALTAVLAAVLIFISSGNAREVGAQGESLKAGSDSERIAFLSQYGWEVSQEVAEVREIVIPREFNETYLNYNKIQQQQGFDLEKYKGSAVKRWSYTVTNYPSYESSKSILANILVCDSTVIGGDICSTELGGFMHTFKQPS